MKFTQSIFIAITIFGQLQAQGVPEGVNLPVYKECGGVIPLTQDYDSNNQKIEYKSGTNFDNDEFCVWTLLPDDSINVITLTVISEFPEFAYDGIVVYTYDDLRGLSSHRITQNTGSFTYNTTMIFIAFSSTLLTVSKGFQFKIVPEGFFGPTSRRAYFMTEEKNSFSYPKVRGKEVYGKNERTSIVLHSAPQSPKQFYEYRLECIDLEENNDFLAAYVLLPFHSFYLSQYQKIGTFTGRTSETVDGATIITLFPVLYIFSSDLKGSGMGFRIEWERYQNKLSVPKA